MSGRWENYFLERNFKAFWMDRLKGAESSVCLILGIGFDPRSLTAIHAIAGCSPGNTVGCYAMCLRPPSSELSENYKKLEELTDANVAALNAIDNVTVHSHEEISLRDREGHLVGGRRAAGIVARNLASIAAYRDVVIDISGLPRTIFFPLIRYLCNQSDAGLIKNLHIVVTEDSELDERIHSGEFGNPDYLYAFRPELPGNIKLIWLPAISSSESSRLEKIHTQIERDCAEICPILPFPAKNLRRADEVVMQLRPIIFERMMVSENNLLLCDERSPFDIYRKILEVDTYYRETLSNLDGLSDVTTVVSPLASKMLSLGMLLAAIERSLPVSYTEAGSYQIAGDTGSLVVGESVMPVEVWLTGEAYH